MKSIASKNGDAPQRGPRMPDLGRMNSDRDAKMARFRYQTLKGEFICLTWSFSIVNLIGSVNSKHPSVNVII